MNNRHLTSKQNPQGLKVKTDLKTDDFPLSTNHNQTAKRHLKSLILALALFLTMWAGTASAQTYRIIHSESLAAPVRAGRASSTGLTAEQVEQAVTEYFASVAAMDVQRFVNNFAPDGVLEDPVGMPPIQGQQAIGAYFAAITAPFAEIKPRLQDVIVGGNEAAVKWKMKTRTHTGKKITFEGIGVFTFNQSGKLQSVREFFDLAALLAQLEN